MTSSPNTNKDKNEHKRKLDNRYEFSPATRKHLAAAAGHKCSIRRCLMPSSCIATKRDGTVGSANFGRASHIYAAAPDGPRPAPPSITPEQIKHHSNGIWTCSGCGVTIDGLECDYSPAQLIEMKKVRETAERMAASDPQVRGISCFISPIEFDEVFWNNLPKLDEEKIRPALMEIAAKNILRGREHSNQEISAPSHLPLKPLASAINTFIDSDVDIQVSILSSPTLHPFPSSSPAVDAHALARRRAVDIVGAWAERIPSPHWNGTGWHVHNVNVLITARHPTTKVLCESSIRAVGQGLGRHDHTSDKGEILHLKVNAHSRVVNNRIGWKLDVAYENGGMRTTSTLRLNGSPSPGYLEGSRWEEGFDSYEQVVRKLAEGWQPVGFVDMSSTESPIDNWMHPEAFEIELQATASELNECLYRCSKIRLAHELQRQWGWQFRFTKEYFERSLDTTMIQAASDELRVRLGPPPYWHQGESPPLGIMGRCDIKFVARNGAISVQNVLRSSFNQPLLATQQALRSDNAKGC